MPDRLNEKHDLLVKLGTLFGPLLRLVEHPGEYDSQERAETIAQYCAEYLLLNAEFRRFSHGQPLHSYSVQEIQFHAALSAIELQLVAGAPLEKIVHQSLAKARAAIDAVPVPRTSVIVEAGSPFTAYVHLRRLCEVDATKSLVWLDPYLDAAVFHRYLSEVRPPITVTLVSAEPSSSSGKRDRSRWEALLDVSRLFSQERDPTAYRFISQPALHDRWVILDDKRIYALGGSAKDAAAKDYFTITSVEGTPENLMLIEQQLASGKELYGPSSPNHQ